jgi:transcriptional regulator with XRE-family HTH domain
MSFARRRAHNASYSLRAFARALEIDHSTLSQMMRGRRAISDRTLEQLARRLGMKKVELECRSEVDRFDEKILGAIANGAQRSSHALAGATGVDVDQVNIALHQLLRLGLLAMQGSRWLVSNGERR